MKHYLRFMLVLLLSTVWCVGGYSQETPEVTLDFTSSSNPWNFPKEYTRDTKVHTYTNNGYTITIQGGSQGDFMFAQTSNNYYLQLYKSNVTLSLPAFDFAVSKIVLEMYSPAKGLKQNIYVDNVAVSTEVSGNKSYSFEINSNKQAVNTIYQIKNSGAASKIKKIHIYKAASSKITTNTTFGTNVDNHTFTVNEGEAFPTHVATMTTAGVDGTIAYASDNAAVNVDQKNGVTSAGTGFGKAKITATFTPIDTETYASSSAYYYIDYKEKTKPATAISFDKSNVTLTTLDYASFTGQTAKLKAGETILTNELAYSKEDAAGVIATLNSSDGTLVLSGKVGTATVTATFNGSAEYASSTASYTITVVDPNKLEVTFDFANNKYGYGTSNNGNGVGDVPVNGTIVSDNGIVTITNLQKGSNNTTFYADNLRFYKGSRTSISVPAGYVLKKIISSANMGNSYATWTSAQMGETVNEWVVTEDVNSVTFTANATIKMANMTVYYAKVEIPTVTFNEEERNDDALLNNENKTVNVTMNRTIGTGYLNPVCFPFAMDATQITEVFGEGSKVSSLSTGMADGNLHFDYVETMEAGKPYLVEPTRSSTTIEVKNVTIKVLSPEYDVAEDNGGNIYSFQGTFEPYAFTATDGTELFLGKDNTLYMPQSKGQKMKGFRAYFTTPKANESLKVVVNGQTTTISSLMSGKTMTGKVYNLNGQYVGTSLEGLAKGVYVMNGQKFVVK